MSYLEQLRAKHAGLIEARAAKLAELEAITATAAAEERSDLTDDEDAAFAETRDAVNAIDGDIDAVEARIGELEQIEARARKAADVPFNVNGGRSSDDPYDAEFRSAPRTAETVADVRERAKRALANESTITDEQRDKADALLRTADAGGSFAHHVVSTGRPAYRSAWAKLVTDPHPVLSADEARALEEVRAVTAGGTTGGGYLMPFTLDPTIIETSSGVINPVRMLSRVRTTTTDNWQGVSSAGVTAAYAAESAEVADGTPTLAQPAIPVEQAHAFVPFTVQAEDDFAQLSSDIGRMFATAKDELEAAKFTLGAGSGSNEPKGIITAVAAVSGSVVDSATTDTYAVADVFAVQNALPARHRANAKWMASLPIINLTRAFGTALAYTFLADLAGDVPQALLGQPLYENSSMDAAINAAATNNVLLYGDFDKYQIVDRIGMTIELVPHLFATANNLPNGQRGWYARWRNGADVLDANAFRLLDVT